MTSLFDRIFIAHPRSIDESYAEHARTAFGFGWRMTTGGLACMVHALIPALFTDTASRTVGGLERTMRERAANRRPAPGHAMADHEFAWVI
jgi:hypothetical protein